jgi:hypothetical protein
VEPKTPPPDNNPFARELSDLLRPAVEQVRAAPPPKETLARALDKARRLATPSRRPLRLAVPFAYAAASVAAILLVALIFRTDQHAPHSDAYAESEKEGLEPYNDLGYYGPAQALTVKSQSRIHTHDDETEAEQLARLRGLLSKEERLIARTELGKEERDYDARLQPKIPVMKQVEDAADKFDEKEKAFDLTKASEPQDDSLGGKGRGNGQVDMKKAKEVAAKWGELSDKERGEALEQLTRELPADQRETVGKFFGELSRLRPNGDKGKDAQPDKSPLVWHQDERRPTLARVYVGDGNTLELVRLHVSVTVEGPRARTVVDHVFRNPHDQRLEGTFEYPLPAGASPSYFAMFLGATSGDAPRFARRGDGPPLSSEALASLEPSELVKNIDDHDWGKLQEARIVSDEKATETYEQVVRKRVDPALLEYAGGNTFRGRVFPITPKGYNRVILAYEETLPVAGDKILYRFPLPGCKLSEMSFTLQAGAADCREPAFSPKDAVKQEGGGRVTFTKDWKDDKPEGEILFSAAPARPAVQAVSGRQGDNGPCYVYARLRPDLKKVEKPAAFADHAVFLLDTSLSEHPDRFTVSMKLLRKILESDPDIKQFNVLTFNVGAAWVEPKGWLANTAEGREAAFARLDGLVLEGATDLSCALDKLAAPGFAVAPGTPLNCFLLSDGNVTWGENDAGTLAARFARRCPFPTRFYCYRTGLGEENAELYDALTRAGGGVFTCYGEADVAAAAQAHRSQCLTVEKVRFVGGPAVNDVLVAGRKAAVYPGGELIVTGRAAAPGKTTVVVEGTFQGEKFAEEFPLEVAASGELAPRAWAEVAVASLLALNDPKLEPLATAYCQQFGVVSRVASFLVLEDENDYKRLNLEAERGRTLDGDLGVFVNDEWAALGRAVPPRQAFRRLLARVEGRVQLLQGENGAHVRKLLDLLTDDDFDLPASAVRGALVRRTDVPAEYLSARDKDPRDVGPYIQEAKRRAAADDVDGAVRVLSTVIEEHPTRGDALRLVGYRLLDMQQPAQAAALFARVQRSRPFEPHSYRDLTRGLEESGKYGLAALQYEIVLAGQWDNRFRESLKEVAGEEYARMMQDALRRKAVTGELADLFGERLEAMRRAQPAADLRVTISWNTDATDVDLWVIEPDGTKVYYEHRTSGHGGELSQDMTQGYGPERYQIAKAQSGAYTVVVHYFGTNPNLLGGETHVNVAVVRKAGSADETVERRTVVLKKHGEQVEVCKVKF